MNKADELYKEGEHFYTICTHDTPSYLKMKQACDLYKSEIARLEKGLFQKNQIIINYENKDNMVIRCKRFERKANDYEKLYTSIREKVEYIINYKIRKIECIEPKDREHEKVCFKGIDILQEIKTEILKEMGGE